VSDLALIGLGPAPDEVLDRLEADLQRILRLPTRRLPSLGEPVAAYDASRKQWSATEMLKTLLPWAQDKTARCLGVTERDLFVPVLSFVYGQAQLRGRLAVISLARLRPEFYGLPPDPERLARRAATEAVHELGHTLGLVHCAEPGCPMSLSIALPDLDAKRAEPCASCSALLEGSLEMLRSRSQGMNSEGGGR
jgi:archaemetzincin